VSVFNPGPPAATFEAISREVSVFNPGPATATYEAISREVSVYGITNPLPDLTVAILNAPASVVAGTAIQMVYAISNLGPITATGPWANQILLAQDTNSPIVRTIGTAVCSNALVTGDFVTVTQSVILPRELAGNYFLGVAVDSDGAVLESLEGNNRSFVAFNLISSTITLTNPVFLTEGDASYDGKDIVVDGCTLTVDGNHTLQSLILRNGAVVTHSAGRANGLRLQVAGDVVVEAGGAITADGKGYPVSQGPGAGGYKVGGSYGGVGGGGRPTYGLAMEPLDLGSGGGSSSYSPGWGNGGGLVHLTVGGILRVDGVISAGGSYNWGGGGGSGGSVNVRAGMLSGSGTISAHGAGAGEASSGGGGRIAVRAGTNTFAGSVAACGGYHEFSANAGQGGTVFFQAGSTLRVDGGGCAEREGRCELSGTNSLEWANFDVEVNGGTLVADTAQTFRSLLVRTNGSVTHSAGSTNGLRLQVVGDVVVEAGGAITADGKGYPVKQGPGFGDPNAGASYGGVGGGGGRPTYGSAMEPADLGSGGSGYGYPAASLGSGGGLVHLTVGGTLRVDGAISAGGLYNYGGGGGSGGSVNVRAEMLSGSGAITAQGAYSGPAGSGGGGRVALRAGTNTFAGRVAACGGHNDNSANAGQGGTVFFQAGSTLRVDGGGCAEREGRCELSGTNSLEWADFVVEVNGGTLVADTAQTFRSLVVRTNGSVTHSAGSTNGLRLQVQGDVTVDAGGAITADGKGYPAGQGPGTGGWGVGGSYGGAGGNGGWRVYGSATEPVDLGSGGGGGGGQPGWGAGGGLIRLTVAGTLRVDGLISAAGYWNWDGGGGAGGSIWLTAGQLTGSGTIQANGGNPANGGGGGGGRIALLSDMPIRIGSVQVLGGNGSQRGADGTIYYGSSTGPKPDLVVLSATSTNTALAGQIVPITWSVTNAGIAPAIAPWKETLLLADNPLGTNGIAFATFNNSTDLPASNSVARTRNFILPAGLSGNYWLILQLDSANQVAEGQGETNNFYVSPQPIFIQAPDLQVGSVTALPGAAAFGQSVAVSWVATNTGTGPAQGNWSDRIWLSATSNSLAGAVSLLVAPRSNPLPSSVSYTNGATVTVPLTAQSQPGNYWLVVQADAGNAVAESNEGNNLRSVPLALTLPPLPDLSPGQVASASYAYPGQAVSVTWAVTNLGTAGLTNSWIETVYLLSDAGLDSTNVASRLTPSAAVAAFSFTNALPAGTFLLRTQSVAVPLYADTGNLRFAVLVDSANDVIEAVETNNIALATNNFAVPAVLTLQLPVSQLLEGSPAITATVSRNGSLTQPLLVMLTNSDSTEVTLTNFVIIPAGQASASFTVRALADGIVDGTQFATISASAPGFVSAFQTLTVFDADLPHLTLTLATNTVMEGGSLVASLRHDSANTNALTVFLQCSNPNRLSPPLSVIIPAGTNSVLFTNATVDDDIIQVPETVTISATATGFTASTAGVTIFDNDFPAMTLTLAQTNISEGAGPLATTATLTRWPVTTRPLYLDLESSDTNSARAPARVIIPAGQALATFPIAAVDNTRFDAPRPTLITAYVVLPSTGARLAVGAAAWLVVTDDDGPTLKLALARKMVAEGLSPATTATVTMNFTTNQPVVVRLSSSNTNEATVPHTVTIPTNQNTVTFDVASVNDGVTDGNKPVTITASAAGFTGGSDTLIVTDINLPDLVVSRVTAPTTADTEGNASITYRIENQGLLTAGTNWTTRVSLSRDPVAGSDILLGNYVFNGTLAPGAFYDQTLSLRMPLAAGDYWVVVETDLANQLVESIEDNNIAVSAAPIHVQAGYEAWVQADLHSALAGTPVPMHGAAYRGSTNNPAPGGSQVSIHIFVRGTHRVIPAITDANGSFSTVWTPLPYEAGVYQIGAAHPGDATAPVQDTFRLVGMSATPSSLAIKVIDQGSTSGQVQLANLSDQALTGLAVTALGVPANLQVTPRLNTNYLGALGQVTLAFTVAASSASVLQASVTLHVTSVEGASVDVPLALTVEPQRTRLVANPAELYAGMKRGVQSVVEFEVVNQGGIPSGPITVSLPAAAWLSLASTNPLPSLAVGETNHVSLQLTPPADLPLGDFTGSLSLSCTSASLNVPFTFRSLSEAKGGLRITAVDEYTYYAEGSPKVTNAAVTITDAVSRQVVTNGVTDTNGQFVADGLPESYYQVQVTADKHGVYQGTHLLVPGKMTDITAFMARQTVRYVWTVEQVPFEDRVKINVETLFETYVPVPVVTVEPSYIDLSPLTQPGQQMQVELKISNHGLIAANHGRLVVNNDPRYQVTAFPADIGIIPAMRTVVATLTIKYQPSSGTSALRTRSAKDGEDGGMCYFTVDCISDWPCGSTLNENLNEIVFGIPACFAGGGSYPAYDLPIGFIRDPDRVVSHNGISVSPAHNCDCPDVQVDGQIFVGPTFMEGAPHEVTLSVPGASDVSWVITRGTDLVRLTSPSGSPVKVLPTGAPLSGQVEVQATYTYNGLPCPAKRVSIPFYQVLVQARSEWPRKRDRERIGVGELVDIWAEPEVPFRWGFVTRPHYTATLSPLSSHPGGIQLNAGQVGGDIKITATKPDGVRCAFRFTAIEPQGIAMSRAAGIIDMAHNPESVSMDAYPVFCILPSDVSFQNIEFREGNGNWLWQGAFSGGIPEHCAGGNGCGPIRACPALGIGCSSDGWKVGNYDHFSIGVPVSPDPSTRKFQTGYGRNLWYMLWHPVGDSFAPWKPCDVLEVIWSLDEDGNLTGIRRGSFGEAIYRVNYYDSGWPDGAVRAGLPITCP
jgi:subtilase family serine protease